MKNNLRAIRKSRGYTQLAIQMKTGIEQSLLSKFETGERIPPTDSLIRLADFYGVSIDYLLCRTDVPEINYAKRTATRFLHEKLLVFYTVL